ncbi:DnaJ domain-containing protein [Venenivibrio stagnispumantis]|uniref:DnaJ domain-containing protein n=2 Tax=Venenivibrio stagnispumantis TaxID=407998 RepID=A0AA45WIE7_9AQUI|nr:DnaJ domain-containing protein [Venenivibrio stagnispumantis]
MRLFFYKVIDYIYSKQMELFQSMFFKLYREYNSDIDKFYNAWFENYTLNLMLKFFRKEEFYESYVLYNLRKKSIIKSYIKAYWSFCKNPEKYPYYIKEAMDYFGLKKLTKNELKKKYREFAKKYHPDLNKNKKEATLKMLEINHYYQILKSYVESEDFYEDYQQESKDYAKISS